MRLGLSFSHFGMFAHDLAVMEDFYSRVLEFTVTDRGELPRGADKMNLVFLSRDPDEHHQIVLISGRPASIDFNPINQISLKADSLATLRQMHQRLQQEGSKEIMPVTHGNALSIYARDPENNRLEIFMDLPWYVNQPMRVDADLSLDDDALMERLENHARALPGFKTRAEWRKEMVRRMGLE